MMDAGCYCASAVRLLSGGEPSVRSATAKLLKPGIDGSMAVDLEWPPSAAGGPTLVGRIEASLSEATLAPVQELSVHGAMGSLHCSGWVMPHFGHRISLTSSADASSSSSSGGSGGTGSSVVEEQEYGIGETTYYHQLARFAADVQAFRQQGSSSQQAVLAAMQADAQDCVANCQLLQAAYVAAGMPMRVPTREWRRAAALSGQKQ